MRTKTSSGLTYLAAFAIGILLLIFSNQTDLFRMMVIIIGIILIVPSLFAIVYSWVPAKDEDGRAIPKPWYISGLGILGLVFGILLLCFPSFFAAYIIYTLGIVLILCGMFQIFHILQVSALLPISKSFYIMPAITLVCGIVVIILGPKILAHIASLLTGCFLVGYAINGFIELINEHKRAKGEEKKLIS